MHTKRLNGKARTSWWLRITLVNAVLFVSLQGNRLWAPQKEASLLNSAQRTFCQSSACKDTFCQREAKQCEYFAHSLSSVTASASYSSERPFSRSWDQSQTLWAQNPRCFCVSQWSTLLIDLVSFTGELFKGFLKLDVVTLFASCKVRRIFTMKADSTRIPDDGTGESSHSAVSS